MTIFINSSKINATNPLRRIWPHTPVTRGERVALLHVFQSVNKRIPHSKLAKSTVLGTLENVFVRMGRRWVMRKQEEFHHGRSH